MEFNFKTTFWSDFTIAEHFGVGAVKDTFKRAFKEWKSNVEYVTELVIVLNWKMFALWESKHKLAEVYKSLWEKADGWCMENLKGEDLSYFLDVTD